jgi:transcriptional regulator with XRE-family HTH domain
MNNRIAIRHASSALRGRKAADAAGGQKAHPVDVHVGQQIRIRRIHSNVSQSDLGQGIGVSLQQVQKYEHGRNRVSASMLYEMAACLKIPVSTLFDGLPSTESAEVNPTATVIDARIAYISTAEGRRLIEDVLQLPPKVRSRVVALLSSLANEEFQAPSP